MSGGWC
ncbi:hypothetical protein YPPY52_0922, partial [Yersinia pestis PY-52]